MPRHKAVEAECPKCHSSNVTYNRYEKSIDCKDCNTYSKLEMKYKSCIICDSIYNGTILDDKCPNCTRLKRNIKI